MLHYLPNSPKYSFLVYGELLKSFTVVYEKLNVTDIFFSMGLRKHDACSGLQLFIHWQLQLWLLRHHKWAALAHLLLKGNLSPLGRGRGVLNDGGSGRVNLLQLRCI